MKKFTLHFIITILLYVLATGLTWYFNTTLGIIVGVVSIISIVCISISVSNTKLKLKNDESKKNIE